MKHCIASWVCALGVLATGGAGTACGDALVDSNYRGTPRFVLNGVANGKPEDVGNEHPEVDLALFWVVAVGLEGETLVEQAGTYQRAELFRPFTMKIFDEPRDEDLLLGAGARVGVARVGAFQDANGNRHKDEAEPFLGGSFVRVLLWAPQPLPAAMDSLTGAPLEAGWYVVSTPLACSSLLGSPPPSGDPVPDGDCGVPLGEPCRIDQDCGEGVCLHALGGPWPGGACVIAEPPPSGCRQQGSVLVRTPEPGGPAYWVKSCTRTEDCGRPAPYQCDQQLRACMPTAKILVDIKAVALGGGLCLEPPSGP